METGLPAEISWADFLKVGMYVGTVLRAQPNAKALKPAHVLEIDFGPWGILQSSAQITEHYTPESLVGQQVVAVLNFPVKKIAGIPSQCLVLAAMNDAQGTVLLRPTMPVENGTRIA